MHNFQFSSFSFSIPHDFVVFFSVMANFENALKQSGFVSGQKNKRASPDWNSFTNHLGEVFFNDPTLRSKTNIFFEAPPRSLIVSEEGIAFKDSPPPVNCQQLFETVRCVRNNLFHGSKVSPEQRDLDLVSASLIVLEEAITSCEREDTLRNVYYAFLFGPLGGG